LISSILTRGLLPIDETAPEALNSRLTGATGEDFRAEPAVGQVRSDEVDAGEVVLVIMAAKISFEVGASEAIV
jgi:hypothetical protein